MPKQSRPRKTSRQLHRNIAVVTGTRAEYGLLETAIHAIDQHPRLALQCIAAGMHLVTGTHRDIAFPIATKVRMQKPAPESVPGSQNASVGRHHDAVALGNGVRNFAEAFAQLQPDFVVVLGDRIEAFAAASAASVGGIRVAHLHGGDRAEGVADEAMRHAISKLAHLHFPATTQSKKRLLKMGEQSQAIFNHGSPAADGLDQVVPAENAPEMVVMHHPVGDDEETEYRRMRDLLRVAVKYQPLVMSPNHDPGRDGIMQAIREAKVTPVDHLARPVFLSRLKAARVIVGNSSAGLIESSILKTPAVNVGTRQGGREAPSSVVSCSHQPKAIRQAIREAMAINTSRLRHPYGRGDTGKQIAETLAEINLKDVPLRKRNSY